MALLINKAGKKVTSLTAKEIDLRHLKHFNSELSSDILKLLSSKVMYPMEIARALKVHEQRVYYHIRNLERAKLIQVAKSEPVGGVLTHSYTLSQPAFFVKLKEFEVTRQPAIQPRGEPFLEPFITEGKFNAHLIVGSPDPHGPEKARSRDGYYGMDLALFLGSFLNNVDRLHVQLDTEASGADLRDNLILIGGPVVNSVTQKVNSSLPIFFDDKARCIRSKLSKKKYFDDEIGVIVKTKNPFNDRKSILVVAGKRYAGTRAAIIAFLRYFNDLTKGNVYKKGNPARVVEGIDKDADGVVDDITFKE